MAWTVRPARVGDAPDVARIHVESWRKAYRGQVPDSYLASLSVSARTGYWAGVLGTADPQCEVVEGVAGPMGFVSLGPSRDDLAPADTGEIYAIYLDPQAWGLGAGRALHDHGCTLLVDDGFRAATLWVLSSNTRARSFYQRQGWVPDGVTRVIELDGATLEETRYRKAL